MADNTAHRRYLVVEDDELYREFLDLTLQGLGPGGTVVATSSVEEAVAILTREPIDVCFLDVHLDEGRQGTDVLDYFIDDPIETAFVILTAHTEREIAAEAIRKGASDYLVKGQFSEFQLEKSIEFSIYGKRKQMELFRMALHDTLTGLPNRLLFRDRLERATSRARRDKHPLALFYLDIDGFKAVNDTMGHDVGDELLRAIARRLEKGLRKSDTVARLGGDEFVAIAEGIHEEGPAGIAALAEKLHASLCEPYPVLGRIVQVGASIGIAFFPAESEDLEELVALADRRMYTAKKGGGGVVAG